MRLPIDTSHGVRAWTEENAILNTKCPYVLLAVGRHSLVRGLALVMPAWGQPGELVYPNGVTIVVFNYKVLVLRPLGYKLSPEKLVSLVSVNCNLVPDEGLFAIRCASPSHVWAHGRRALMSRGSPSRGGIAPFVHY